MDYILVTKLGRPSLNLVMGGRVTFSTPLMSFSSFSPPLFL